MSRKLDDVVGLLKHSACAGHNRFSGGQTQTHTLKAGANYWRLDDKKGWNQLKQLKSMSGWSLRSW